MRWQLLVPIKPAVQGKSRLRPATRSSSEHQRLVEAIQLDTIDAALPLLDGPVRAITLITPDPAEARTLVGRRPVTVADDHRAALNPALAAAADRVDADSPGDGVLVLLADLPALTAADLLEVLGHAGQVPRGFVADSDGTGTTMLTALDPADLRPRFGPGSAAAHRASGAQPLPIGLRARADVDTAADLQVCLDAGLGRWTAAAVAGLRAAGALETAPGAVVHPGEA